MPLTVSGPASAPTLVGGSLCTYAPCFSNDDRLLCVPCGSAVRLYSVRTGEQVGLLPGAAPADVAALEEAARGGNSMPVRADGSHAGHSRSVTCVIPHPTNRVQLYTASLDGTVKLWDLYDQSCVATYPVRIVGGDDSDAEKFDRPAIIHMVRGAADLLYLLVDPYLDAPTTGAASDRERSCRIVLYQLSKRTCFILYKVKSATHLALDPSSRMLAAISGHTLRIYDTQRLKKSKFKRHFPYRLSTVTFHPTEPYITLGDEHGHILVMYGYQQSASGGKSNAAITSGSAKDRLAGEDGLVTQTLHWHAHKVGAIMFTQDGHYMLSGGEEGVLVIWQLETGTKHFIPRLQSNILHLSLSHDGNTYALSMGDNRIKFVSAVSNRVERLVAGLSYSAPSAVQSGALTVHTAAPKNADGSIVSSSVARSVRIQPDDPSRQLYIPFVYSPLHSGWFLNSILHPGALQLYDLFADRHLMDADLLQRNMLSRTDGPEGGHNAGGAAAEAANANQPRIEMMALHPRGHKMVTLERRSGSSSSGLPGHVRAAGSNNDSTILKFWEWHSSSSSFVLNTRVEPPHSHATAHQALVSLLWHPDPRENMVVTIGRDHCFRIWREIRKGRGPNVRKEAQARSKRGEDSTARTEGGEDEADEDECYWNCTGVGHYRSYPTSGGAFSSDGSLLAVAYGQVLTLWDPFTLTLKHTLLHPSPSTPVRFVHFVPGTPMLISTTSRAIYVWNLLTLALWWSFDLRVIAMAVDQRSNKGHFAVMVLQPDEEGPQQEDEEEEADEAEEAKDAADEKKAAASTTPAGEQPFRRRQTHLLLFSVHSPVPLRAWPLRDARLETVRLPGSSSASSSALSGGVSTTGATNSFSSPILFANDPAMLRAAATSTTAGSAAQAVIPTSLVYINYKRQLVRLDDIYGDVPAAAAGSLTSSATASSSATSSAEAMARLQAQSQEISMFEQLYGKAHRPAPRTPSFGAQQAPDLPANSSALPALAAGNSSASALGALLNAPSHILPPPSSLFTAVMDSFLARSGAQIASASAAEAAARKARAEAAQQAQAQAQLIEDEDARMGEEEEQEESALRASVHALDAQLLTTDSQPAAQSGAQQGSGLFQWETHPLLSRQFDALVSRIHAGESDDALVLRDVELSPPAAATPAAPSTSTDKAPSSKSKSSKKAAAASTGEPKRKQAASDEAAVGMEVDTDTPPVVEKKKKSSKAKQ